MCSEWIGGPRCPCSVLAVSEMDATDVTESLGARAEWLRSWAVMDLRASRSASADNAFSADVTSRLREPAYRVLRGCNKRVQGATYVRG